MSERRVLASVSASMLAQETARERASLCSRGTFLHAASVAGKLFGALLLKENWPTRWMIGTAMVPRGEVGLIFAELGRESSIFTNEVYAGMVIVIALTTLLPPFVMKWYYGRYGTQML